LKKKVIYSDKEDAELHSKGIHIKCFFFVLFFPFLFF